MMLLQHTTVTVSQCQNMTLLQRGTVTLKSYNILTLYQCHDITLIQLTHLHEFTTLKQHQYMTLFQCNSNVICLLGSVLAMLPILRPDFEISHLDRK